MPRSTVFLAAVALFLLMAAPVAAESESVLVPFDHVDGFMPGVTTVIEVEERFGPPEKREKTKSGFILRFPGRGFHFIVDLKGRPLGDDTRVDAVYVEAPYGGRTPGGLYLGMPKNEALRILEKHFHLDMNLGESCYYWAEKPGEESNFTVWSENGRLVRMKLWPLRDE